MRDRRWAVVLLVAALGLTGASESGGVPEDQDAPAECSVRCWKTTCGDNGHTATSGWTTDEYDGGPHDYCADLPCCVYATGSDPCKHTWCESCIGEDNDAVQALIEAIDAGDWSFVRTIIGDRADMIAVNPTRRAIQVLSRCDADVVIVNLPVPAEQIAWLADRWLAGVVEVQLKAP
jgi:hypothetical protein